MKKLLFICSQNKLRSPTAEFIFSESADLEVRSAGLNHDAVTPLTGEDLQWADIIFLMEDKHKSRLLKRFSRWILDQKIVVLNIPDLYDFMDPKLIQILKTKVPRYLK